MIGEDGMPSLNEWLDYSTLEVPKEWSKYEQGQYVRVNHYWKNVTDQNTSSGLIKYLALSKFVKPALTWAHGNADVERLWSDNKNAVTPERTDLNIETINGLRLAKDNVA